MNNPFKKSWKLISDSATPVDGIGVILIMIVGPIIYSVINLKKIIIK